MARTLLPPQAVDRIEKSNIFSVGINKNHLFIISKIILSNLVVFSFLSDFPKNSLKHVKLELTDFLKLNDR